MSKITFDPTYIIAELPIFQIPAVSPKSTSKFGSAIPNVMLVRVLIENVIIDRLREEAAAHPFVERVIPKDVAAEIEAANAPKVKETKTTKRKMAAAGGSRAKKKRLKITKTLLKDESSDVDEETDTENLQRKSKSELRKEDMYSSEQHQPSTSQPTSTFDTSTSQPKTSEPISKPISPPRTITSSGFFHDLISTSVSTPPYSIPMSTSVSTPPSSYDPDNIIQTPPPPSTTQQTLPISVPISYEPISTTPTSSMLIQVLCIQLED